MSESSECPSVNSRSKSDWNARSEFIEKLLELKKKYFSRARENLIARLLNNQIACEMCLSTVSCRESFAHSAQRRACNA